MKKIILSFILVGALVAPAASHTATPKPNLTEWVVPSLLTVGALYYIWSHWDSARPLFTETKERWVTTSCVTKPYKTTFNVISEGDGAGAALDQESVTLIQKPVSQQGENNDGGASCAYHALKNAVGVLTKNTDLFTNTDFITRQFSLDPGIWRAWVQTVQHDDGEWVHTEFYENLIRRVFAERNIITGWSVVNAQGQPINEAHVGKDIYGILRTLRPEDSYKHVFFVNTANGYTVGQHGHWFVMIMEKEAHGPTTYTVMDSLGHERHQDKTVLAIITALHK